jgi:hypothetical protein
MSDATPVRKNVDKEKNKKLLTQSVHREHENSDEKKMMVDGKRFVRLHYVR